MGAYLLPYGSLAQRGRGRADNAKRPKTYERPQATMGSRIARALVASPSMTPITIPIAEMNSIDLPPVCVGTGTRNEVTFRKVKFAWYPRWVWVLIFVPFGGLLLAAVVAAVLTKRAKGELPFSDAAWSRWRLGKILTALAVVVLLASLFGGIILLAQESSGSGALTLLLGLAVPLIAAVIFGRWGPQPVKITDQELTLNIPSAEAAIAIRDHLHAGRPAQPGQVARAG